MNALLKEHRVSTRPNHPTKNKTKNKQILDLSFTLKAIFKTSNQDTAKSEGKTTSTPSHPQKLDQIRLVNKQEQNKWPTPSFSKKNTNDTPNYESHG